MKSDRKPVPSKLDAFSAELLALNDEGKKLSEIQQWLKGRNVTASINCISNFLTKLRTKRARKAKGRDDYHLPYYPKLQKDLEWRRKIRAEVEAGKSPRKLRGVNR